MIKMAEIAPIHLVDSFFLRMTAVLSLLSFSPLSLLQCLPPRPPCLSSPLSKISGGLDILANKLLLQYLLLSKLSPLPNGPKEPLLTLLPCNPSPCRFYVHIEQDNCISPSLRPPSNLPLPVA